MRQFSLTMRKTSFPKLLAYIICAFCLYIFLYPYKEVLFRYSSIYQHTQVPTATVKLIGVDCNPGVPCIYPENVDFRIIVMTFDRHASLGKLLESLDKLEGLGDDKAIIEIWIDRDKNQTISKAVVETAESFNWTKGEVRINVHKKHVGIIGQWIHTWRPLVNGKEIAVFLEDDISASPHMYRWLKAAHMAYDTRKDVGGYTLHCGDQMKARGGGWLDQPTGSAFLYKLLGTWGYSPHPQTWRDFQDWLAVVVKNLTFRPYVDGMITTKWYKNFEKRHFEDSLWDQWWSYYCDKFNFYSVYNNMHHIVNRTENKGYCLMVNRREPGLHQYGKGRDDTHLMMTVWKEEYNTFCNTPVRLEWNGKPKSN